MAKRNAQTAPAAWRNRIVGHGEEAPGALVANPRNWRVHPKAQTDALAGALGEVGWVTHVIVNRRTGCLVDGHARVELAVARKESAVPVVYVDLSEEEEAIVLASLDPLAAMATTNQERLDALMREVSPKDEALREMLAGLASAGGGGRDVEDPGAQTDRAAELQAEWKTAAGQLWEIPSLSALGKAHRLLCGDSTAPANVARLMGEERAGVIATDPPYGVALDLEKTHTASNIAKGSKSRYRQFAKIAGDDLTGDELLRFLTSAFEAARTALRSDAAWYVWHASLKGETFLAALRAAGVEVFQHLVWVKPSFVFGRSDYHWQHEPCAYGWVKGHRPRFHGERNQGTTWQTDVGGGTIRRDQAHPTEKPVSLFTPPLRNHLLPGEISFEPFAGSGSHFVAGEQTGRVVYGVEIEPGYVAVVLERMKGLGLEPRLVEEGEKWAA